MFLLTIVATNCLAQSPKDQAKNINTGLGKVEDTGNIKIPIEYTNKPDNNRPIAYFVNGRFETWTLDKIDPGKVENVNIVKMDTVIDGTRYYGQVYLKVKDYDSNYTPNLITLRDLVDEYTKLKNKPVIFTIDGRFINADYTNYKIDKNSILKIVLDKFANSKDPNEVWIANVLTKSKENIERSKQIRIRGSSSIAKN